MDVEMDDRQAGFKRAALGAFYGLLIGTVFALTAAYIDLWLHPDLPFGVNWSVFMIRFPLIALGLALTGALTCWWNESWYGVLSGSLFLAALALVTALFTSEVAAEAKFILLLFIIMPLAVMSLPIILILRRITVAHASALGMNRKHLRIAWLLILSVALGMGGGYLMKTSARGVESTRLLHGMLQSIESEDNPLQKTEGAREHASTPYELYTTRSATSTEGFDIRVKYTDGFTLDCTIVSYPGYKPYLRACTSGE